MVGDSQCAARVAQAFARGERHRPVMPVACSRAGSRIRGDVRGGTQPALGSTTAISAQDAAVNALLARDAGVAGLQTAVRAQLFALNPADDAEIVQAESDPALAGELLVDARTDPALAAQLLMLGTATTQSGSVAATTLPTPQDTPTLGGLTSDSTHCYHGEQVIGPV